MNMTLDVGRNGKLGPAPVSQRARIEFQLAARRGKAAFDFAVDFHADQTAAIRIAIGAGNRNDVWRSGFGRAREHAAELIFANVFEFFARHGLFIDRADSSA